MTHRSILPAADRPSRSLAVGARLLVSTLLAVAAVVGLLPASPTPAARAAATVPLPFAGGEVVRIIQGYNGGTHRGRSQYGLDLVLARGGTSGAGVLSPFDGQVAWAFAPGAGNGCIGIAARDGGHSVLLCHVVLDRAYRRGESVARGQRIGTVGPPGAVGNNGTPHVHMELHRGATARAPVPFSPPSGLPLEGVDLPASGAYNEHGARATIVSTNGSGAPPPPAAAVPPPDRSSPSSRGVSAQRAAAPTPPPPTPSRPAPPPPTPTPSPAASPPAPTGATSTRSAPPSASTAPPPAATPTPSATRTTAERAQSSSPAARPPEPGSAPERRAVVHGTDSCLKVREQPSLDASAVACLPDGAEVPLTSAARDEGERRWRQVSDLGWASASYLRLTRAVVAGTGDCLNVRAGPSTDAPVLACLPDGTAVRVAEGPSGDGSPAWYRIEPPGANGHGGWVAAQYLS